MYTQTLKQLASYGYLVFGIFHQDGSCMHTVTRDGKDLYHGPRNYNIEDQYDKKSKELKIRE